MKKILAFGEILWDIIEDKEYLGGAPFNLTAHFRQLGGSASIVSSLGRDKRGELALKKASEIGINLDYISQNEHPTGFVTVEILDKGIPSYTINEGVAYDNIKLNQSSLQNITGQNFDIFCFGTLAQRNEVSRQSLEQLLAVSEFEHIFYDVNLRQNYYNEKIIKKSLDSASIVKLNDNEVRILSRLLTGGIKTDEEFSQILIKDFSVQTVIITRGEHGCLVADKDKAFSIPGIKVQTADTVGAGDAFGAGFLFEFMESGNLEKSAKFGNRLGAYVVSHRGAIPDLKGFNY